MRVRSAPAARDRDTSAAGFLVRGVIGKDRRERAVGVDQLEPKPLLHRLPAFGRGGQLLQIHSEFVGEVGGILPRHLLAQRRDAVDLFRLGTQIAGPFDPEIRRRFQVDAIRQRGIDLKAVERLHIRHGLGGKLIDFGKQQELPATDLIRELLDWFIGDVVDELGSRREVEYAYRILAEGSSADRQLATYRRTNDLSAVVDQLIAETEEGVVGGTPKAEGALA